VKDLLSLLKYGPVILVGLVGAYIVFHMWQLSEVGHSKSFRQTPPGKGRIGQENSPPVKEKPSPNAIASPSPTE
jgi:hypothetical protein